MKEKNKVKKGKLNRQNGAIFESRVRKDLEAKDWIVSKWQNNVEWLEDNINRPPEEREGKLVPAKNKFRGKNIPMQLGSGFPDFIAYKLEYHCDDFTEYEVIGVEVKTNGKLSKIEKEKCKWLLENNIFSNILIAKKTKVKGRIVIEYKEFK